MHPYLILLIFLTVAYYVLKWIQRRNQYINLPKLAEGQWHPLLANYTWASDNKFKEEFYRLKSDSAKTTPIQLSQALMKRAMHDVDQMKEMQQQKQTLQQLVKTGAIGEEVYLRFQKAEGLLGEEFEEVCVEAEGLKAGWGQTIFQQAHSMLMIEQKRAFEMEQRKEEEEKKAQVKWDAEQMAKDRQLKEEESRRIADELIREEEQKKSSKKKK